MKHLATISLCALMALLFTGLAFGQTGYVTGGIGYGLSAGTGYLTAKTSSGNWEGVYGSFGEGIRFQASGGYMINKNIGAELAFAYLLGKEFEGTSSSTNAFLPYTYSSSGTEKWKGSGFMLTPSVIISAGTEKINPYARFGLVLGFLKGVKKEDGTSTTDSLSVRISTRTSQEEFEETGSIAFGYAGGVGAVFSMGSSVDFFSEVSLMCVTYAPAQVEQTKYTVDGVDRLSTLTQTKWDYKDSHSTGVNNRDENGVRRPFSSIGITIGVRYAFGSK